MSREQMIYKLEECGKQYRWDKYKDSQIFYMYVRIVLKK